MRLPAKTIKKIGEYLAAQKDVAAAYLFGSHGTLQEHGFSDIDLGLVYYPGMEPDFRRELALEAKLSMILGTDNLDLVNLNRASLQLRYRAVAEGTLLFEGGPDTLSDFLEQTYRLYGDYQIDLKAFYDEYRLALREAYLDD
ncbi:MAG: nucleotidyltransferase domain-containing protein [Peptococcaceae bacterium]|nr:nucleotidyltransferase domain-containing protein [Peptococcaceae bacterium]